jgi:16S rRNA (adenine1518-N6/adenine1519-N6)-dimethyltransferase
MEFNFKKKYGQNFINDKNVINNICKLVDANEDDLIIEIGPGAGAITGILTQLNSYYIAYEIDVELDNYLSKYTSTKFRIIYDDFLKRDIKEDIKDIKYNRLFIVGNLPYYITTPILLSLVDNKIKSYKNIFMVQKEFGDRLTAKPGNREYGSITALLNNFYDIKKELFIPKEKFTPKPKVDSVIISLLTKESNVNYSKYKKFIRDAFQFKRKNLRNNLKGYDLEAIEAVLKKHNYTLNNRAEDIPYEVFVDIINTILS